MDLDEYREVVEMRDSTRKESLSIMEKNPNIIYPEAWEEAMTDLFGSYFPMIQNSSQEDMDDAILAKAKEELGPNIRVDLYDNAQLMAMMAAKRMGVDLEDYVNIFQTPEQIRFLALATLMEVDVTPYALDLHFDPDKEMQRLVEQNQE